MGRTGSSWGKVGLFYVIFYAGLAAFFSIMLVVFYQTLDNYEPKWQLTRSVIGTNPGMGFRPMPPESNIESTLIWFEQGQNRTMNHWIKNLQSFLAPYREKNTPGEFGECEKKPEKEADSKSVCDFQVENDRMKECVEGKFYGYDKGRPCVAVKLNRIYGWKPDYITKDDIDRFDRDIPDQLRSVIMAHTGPHDMVWLYCEGENPADKENAGRIEYFNPADVEVTLDATAQRRVAVLRSDGCEVESGGVVTMSKSKNNGVDPQALVDEFGADTARLFTMFAAPPEQTLEWSDEGVQGASRFIKRLWKAVHDPREPGAAGAARQGRPERGAAGNPQTGASNPGEDHRKVALSVTIKEKH